MKAPTVPPLPPIDVESILAMLAEFRRTIPHMDETIELRKKRKENEKEQNFDRHAEIIPTSTIEFDWLVAAEALQEFADELGETIEREHAELVEKCHRIYWAGEELLVTDPEEGEKIRPHLEAMQKAHQECYGKPIPPNPNRK